MEKWWKMEFRRIFAEIGRLTGLRIEAAIRRLPVTYVPELQVFCCPSAINRRNANSAQRLTKGSFGISIQPSAFCLVLSFTGDLRFLTGGSPVSHHSFLY
ncbi:hypothetical protein HAX54_049830, partial [Datura stramonium]|nr:hypothetical protein [Datura stramonium]